MPKQTFYNLITEKQEKIMRSAINEFLNNGYEKGNIGNIAKNAGVAKGSMYQYFENKKELFLFCIQWASTLIVQKYGNFSAYKEKEINLFDYIYESTTAMWFQIKEERNVITFIQNAFMGNYGSVTEEATKSMMEISNTYTLNLIRDGKKHGYIRKDIDDMMLLMFMTGAFAKIREYLFKKSDNLGQNILDEDFEEYKKQSKAMLDLIKNGMGAK
ncbi:TetR/AcrR family transcriptional regulator [Clostridium felsineum]|uniref:TetR/AcrR family transcriptional regulator n=1 Tax=Clostridium felsineum TaxID=36839 RepID=UPI00098C17E8|nr:TetR/AcrR family transcriptional regulator [Clostridium felsineum]